MKRVIDFFHKFFVPKEENNFRAKALHSDFLSLYLILAIILSFSLKNGLNLNNVLGFATNITIEKIIDLTNAERSKSSLNKLSYNDNLSLAAKKKAEDMFNKNYWAHYSPDGATPWDFILESNYQYEYAGENLAKNFMFSQGVVDAWMNSKTHRDNILRKEYTEIGIAIVNGVLNNEETTLVVQMFGKPLNNVLSKTVSASEPEKIAVAEKPIVKNEVATNNIPLSGKTVTAPSHQRLPINFYYVFFGFLILALIMDFYFASKLNIIRITGKNFIHIIFIVFVMIGLIFITKGAIV